jgi:hypothetical protein
MPATKSKLKGVTRSAPCELCAGRDGCARGADGLRLCRRSSGPFPGFVHLGPAKGDPQWHLYRVENDPALDRERPWRAAPKVSIRPPIDWTARAKELAGNLTPALADELCARLDLPRLALDVLQGIGYDLATQSWTFPEVNARGEVIGIVRRYRDGSKRAMPGSQRGLTIPKKWRECETPVCVIEGPSDTLALSLCAVSCIGRPSNCGGVDLLAELLSNFPIDRSIVVLGENDAKPDGAWPGKDGAIRVASTLSERLQRRIAWALPPDDAKDVRAWILSQKPDPRVLDDWHIIGEKLWA